MGARNKLNAMHLQMALIIAGFLGIAMGSWWMFVLTFAAMAGLALHAGDLRGPRRRF